MDWLKKWFSFSDKKDVKDHGESHLIEIHQKDVQTKMTFKYPDKELQIPAVERKKKRQRSFSERDNPNVRRFDRLEMKETDLHEHKNKHRQVENVSERPNGGNRKWRISHAETIPSPIYGYRRRTEKNEEPIEFELYPFDIDIQREEKDRSSIRKFTTESGNEEEKRDGKEKIRPTKNTTVDKPISLENVIDEESMVDGESIFNWSIPSKTIEEKPISDQTKDEAIDRSKEMSVEGETFSPKHLEQRSDAAEKTTVDTIVEEQFPLAKKTKSGKNEHFPVQSVNREWEVIEIEKIEGAEKSKQEDRKFGAEGSNFTKKDSEQTIPISTDMDRQGMKESSDQIDSPSNVEPENSVPSNQYNNPHPSKTHSYPEKLKEKTHEEENHQTTKRKKTVPFNVLMLKSDREKLQKRKEQASDFIHTKDDMKKRQQKHEERPYHLPPIHLLNRSMEHSSNIEWVAEQVEVLNETLKSFHVAAKVVSTSEGPSVTRFEISPEMGVKVNKITNLTDDLKLSLAAKDIRIEAPIPGKHTIGIEVPNVQRRPVFLREIIEQNEYKQASSPLTVAVGLDIAGKPVITDLKKMPHGLIAGATGSGKSVCINTFIISLLYKARPDEVKLLMIDPKMVELAPYNGIPHLISPVITDVKAATQALKWAVEEMERRYERFAEKGVRDIERYNEKESEKMPFIVIIIDELADLMMMAPADVEDAICRIAQKARACGIHLLIATQRPSVDVITGLIKANVPTRIAFSVSSQVDSRTIIDISGAERLLGKGDMLFLENGTSKPVRLQGPFISDDEIESVVEHVRKEGEPEYLFQQEELIKKSDMADQDELFLEACEFAVQQGSISTSSLQRRFRIGYNRAARLIELMEEKGIITEQRGSKPRDVLITEQDLHQFNK
ncbi:DNA translocase FtsK [Fervidibacillus halotolerans]|uniref:DNA translocase FtsK n=1 Tax=Fervidibacillus halotolerans TaxID=2980027 RepID=UPI0023B24A8D|nr:DNA translocase FtsK [Fervidibacillus halotolerans]